MAFRKAAGAPLPPHIRLAAHSNDASCILRHTKEGSASVRQRINITAGGDFLPALLQQEGYLFRTTGTWRER